HVSLANFLLDQSIVNLYKQSFQEHSAVPHFSFHRALRKTKVRQISNARTRLDPGIRWMPDEGSQDHSYRYGRVLCVRRAEGRSSARWQTRCCGLAREPLRRVCGFV